MLLIDISKEENEINWFFPEGEMSPYLKSSQFLGWSMGSPGSKEQQARDKSKNTSAVPTRKPTIATTTVTDNYNSRGKISHGCVKQRADILADPTKTWKTILVGDSTIHYIPLEVFFTTAPAAHPVHPAEDAFDPFYLDPMQIESSRRPYNLVPQKIYQLAPQREMEYELPPLEQNAFRRTFQYPIPRVPFDRRAHYRPLQYGHVYYNRPAHAPALLPDVRNVVNADRIHNDSEAKTGADALTEPIRHTMFIHPKLLDMMKAMDRSILSYPSRFDYKAMDRNPIGGKRPPIKRHNNKKPQ